MEESLQFLLTFAYLVSFLNPESSFRNNLQSLSKGLEWGVGATSLEAPGRRLACGVPTFLSCWGHLVERLAGLMGNSVDVGGAAALLSLGCLSAQCWCYSQAVQLSPHWDESLHGEGLGRFLWMCSGLSLSRGSGDGTVQWKSTEIKERLHTANYFLSHDINPWQPVNVGVVFGSSFQGFISLTFLLVLINNK